MERHPGFSNWRDFIVALEEGAAELEGDSVALSARYLQVAHLWEDKLLDKKRAILNYQQAFKAQTLVQKSCPKGMDEDALIMAVAEHLFDEANAS